MTIKDLVNKNTGSTSHQKSRYNTDCKNHKNCVDETSRNFKIHIYEHKIDLHWDNPLNSLVAHRIKTNHNFDFKNVTLIKIKK